MFIFQTMLAMIFEEIKKTAGEERIFNNRLEIYTKASVLGIEPKKTTVSFHLFTLLRFRCFFQHVFIMILTQKFTDSEKNWFTIEKSKIQKITEDSKIHKEYYWRDQNPQLSHQNDHDEYWYYNFLNIITIQKAEVFHLISTCEHVFLRSDEQKLKIAKWSNL